MNITIGDLVTNKRQLIFVEMDAKIAHVLKLFKDKQILGAPVYDCSKNEFVGMIDVLAIVRFVALGCFGDKTYGDEQFREFKFPNGNVGDIINRDPNGRCFTLLKSSNPLSLALKALVEDRRVLVLNELDNTLRILTQTDIIKYFNDQKDKLSSYSIQISEIKSLIGNELEHDVIKIQNTDKALDGFMKMLDCGVPAVAVVNEFGVLVANLSSSDLKGVALDTINSVFLPVTKFLKVVSGDLPNNPLVCSKDSTINELLPIIVEKKVHRIWVVNWEGRPTGVVSLTDLIKTIWKSVVAAE